MYGDTAASRKRVAQLREQGGDIQVIADRLVAQAESVPWHGRAAEAMRVRIKDRANQLRVAAGHHEAAATTLATHIAQVDGLKDAIAAIEQKAGRLTADAATRVAQLEEGAEPDPEDDALTSFVPPPAGHKDWLDVELPGL